MRIAIVTDYYWPHVGGGVEVVTRQIAERLAERGHDVSVLTLRTAGGEAEEDVKGVHVTRLPAVQLTRLLSLQAALPRNPLAPSRWLRRVHPDVLHLNGRFFATTVLAMAAKRHIPTAFTVHVAPVHIGAAVTLYEKTVSRWVLHSADLVSAISSTARLVWPQATIIPHGVDTERFKPAASSSESFRVLFAGRLIRNKGPQYLIEAVPELDPAITVDIVGDGPMRTQLESRVKSLGLSERITFHGIRNDMPDLLAASRVFVRPSDTGAGDLAVLEALASGLPVIASRASAGDFIRSGENGFVLDGVSPSEIASLINGLHEDTFRYQAIALAARRTAKQYSWDATVDLYEQLYRDCIERTKEAHAIPEVS